MKKLVLIVGFGFLFTACRKEGSDVFVPYPNNPLNDTVWATQVAADAAAYRISSELAIDPLTDSFDAGMTSIIHFSNNVEVTIPGGSCVFSNGNAVSGRVTLELVHLGTKGDFIRLARPSTSFTDILESGGAFRFHAHQNGEEVYLRPNKRAIISFNQPNPVSNMRVFYGELEPQPPLPIGTNPAFTWLPAMDSSRVTTFTRIDSTGVVTGYNMFTGRFDWLNCQFYLDSTLPKTRITTIFPANYTNTNTTVYAVFRNSKTVVQLYGDYESRTFFAPNLPINSDITIVTISLRGTEFYLGVKDLTVSDNLVTSITPEFKSKAEIEAFLDSL